ncbi:MAG: 5'/3'-nucleotidase SurE [Conexivisphaerales archaeon]
MAKVKILVSNDDGPSSPGVQALVKSLSEFAEVYPVIPETPRSGTSMSLTFHKPLRIREVSVAGRRGYLVSGNPADSVMMALNRILESRPDVMASGINIGDNTGLQDVFASGTVQAAIQAAFAGIPSVAFSMQIQEAAIFSPAEAKGNFQAASDWACRIIKWIAYEGLPEGVDLLNVNFPLRVSKDTKVVVARLAKKKYQNYVEQRLDPRGRPYYWVWGKRLEKYEEGTDAYAVLERGFISVTPLKVDLTASDADLERLIKHLASH